MDDLISWSNWESQLNAKTAARRHAEALMAAADESQRICSLEARLRIWNRFLKATHRRMICDAIIDTVFAVVVSVAAVLAFAVVAS